MPVAGWKTHFIHFKFRPSSFITVFVGVFKDRETGIPWKEF